MQRSCSCLAHFEISPLEALKTSDKMLSGEQKIEGELVFYRSFTLCEVAAASFGSVCLSVIHIAY